MKKAFWLSLLIVILAGAYAWASGSSNGGAGFGGGAGGSGGGSSGSAGTNGFAGNNLVNFFNSALVTNGHKQLFYVGESTVYAQSNWYTEFCTQIGYASNQFLVQAGMTPCTTGGTTNAITGYQIMDNAGTITITFSPATPPGYTIGDLVLSQPNSPCSNTMLGTGVVTAVGGTTITYTLLNINGLPVTTAFAACGGTFTNSILNFGYNGATSTLVGTKVMPFLATYAHAGDLVLVRGPIINDVRLGAATLAQLTANITALYNSIVATVPATTDIAWTDENSFLTTDPTATGSVSPLGSSAAYSKEMHDAVMQAFATLPAQRAAVWDTMQLDYSKIGFEPATSAWYIDIIHPAPVAQSREADTDVAILAGIWSGKGYADSPPPDAFGNTATNAGALNGGPLAFFNYLRTLVGFTRTIEERAQDDSYGTPWTLYPDAVLDSDQYDPVLWGQYNTSTATSVRLTHPAVNGTNGTSVKVGDLVWIQGYGVFQAPSGVGQSSTSSGGVVYITTITGLSGIPNTTIQGNPYVVVVRQHTYQLQDVPYYNDPGSFPYRHRILVGAAGNGFFRIIFQDRPILFPSAITTTDVVSLPCGFIPLTSATFAASGTQTQISTTGDWTSCANQAGWVLGPQQPEVVGQVKSWWSGSSNAVVSNSAANFFPALGTGTPVINTSEGVVSTMAPGIGVIRNMTCKLYTIAGVLTAAGGTNYVLALRQNIASSIITCTIATAGTGCSDATHTITTAVGDQLDYIITPTGTPTALVAKCSVEVVTGQ